MEGTEIQYNLTQTIIIIIVVTLILLLILRLLKYIFPLLPRKERTREWIKKNFVYTESIIWMIYIAIIIPYLHKTNIIFEIIAVSIILIAIILIGYYFGRDFFAGIVFKCAYKIKEGDFIQYKDTVGKVKKLGMQNIEMESDDNRLIFIPYTSAKRGILSKIFNNEQSLTCTFSFTINSPTVSKETISSIKTYLLSHPSVSTQYEPIIKFNQDEKMNTLVTVSFTTLDESMDDTIIENVKNKFK